MLKNIYIAGGMRTPFGSFGGSLSTLTAAQLGSAAIKSTLKRSGIDADTVDEVIFGNVVGAGLGQNIARQATLGAGLSTAVGATTVNKVCGSGIRAAILAAQAVQCDDARLIVAGGTESMSNAPYLLKKARTGYRMGNGELIDAMIHDGLWDVYTNQHMGHCGDLCANKFGFSRNDQDDFALASYQRAVASWENGTFAEEVDPIEVTSRKGSTMVERDEDVGKFRGEEKLRSLGPAFGKDSTVTAGNASGISDGAASMMVFGDEAMKEYGIQPRARILGHANAAMESDWFTIAPIHAIRRLCDKLNLKTSDVDLFEINEAFSVVTMAAIKDLELDHACVDVAGGAVAIGHPIGATGARLITTLANSLHRLDKKIGIACACIGGGEATAIAVERC